MLAYFKAIYIPADSTLDKQENIPLCKKYPNSTDSQCWFPVELLLPAPHFMEEKHFPPFAFNSFAVSPHYIHQDTHTPPQVHENSSLPLWTQKRGEATWGWRIYRASGGHGLLKSKPAPRPCLDVSRNKLGLDQERETATKLVPRRLSHLGLGREGSTRHGR